MQTVTSATRTRYCGAMDPIAARIEPGEVFAVETTSFGENYTFDNVHTLKVELAVAPLTGPIWVEGARPGMALKVEILKLEVARDFGVMLLNAGSGPFGEHFPEPVIRGVRVDRTFAYFGEDLEIPISPMFGKISTAPAGEPVLSNRPGPHGGNMDDNHICEGASVYLPVFVEGAYLGMGDGHAVQGDGEAGGATVECEMRAILRCSLVPDLDLTHPVVVSRGKTMTVAEGETLEEASNKAIRNMAQLLIRRREMSLTDAALLLGMVADLHACQIVNPLVCMKVLVPSSLLPLP